MNRAEIAEVNGLRGKVSVRLIGLLGTGAGLLHLLPLLHHTLVAQDRPGIELMASDTAVVTPELLARHALHPATLGERLSSTLVQRVNMSAQTTWSGREKVVPFIKTWNTQELSIVITAINGRSQRHTLRRDINGIDARLWLDIHQTDTELYVLLGSFLNEDDLPSPDQLFPLLFTDRPEHNAERSEPYPGSLADVLAARLLWDACKPVPLTYQGYRVQLQTGRIDTIPVPQSGKTQAHSL